MSIPVTPPLALAHLNSIALNSLQLKCKIQMQLYLKRNEKPRNYLRCRHMSPLGCIWTLNRYSPWITAEDFTFEVATDKK